jgi:RHS repeat-associated protein
MEMACFGFVFSVATPSTRRAFRLLFHIPFSQRTRRLRCPEKNRGSQCTGKLRFRFVAGLGTVILGLVALSIAQLPSDGDQNLPPFGGFTGSDFDIVSLQNGNLHLSIPLVEVAERGGTKSWYKYVYDTPNYVYTFFPPAVPPKTGNAYYTVKPDVSYSGWRLASPFYWGTTQTFATIVCYKGENNQHNSQWEFFTLSDPEGVKHPFGVGINSDTDGCVSPKTDAAPALDGSGMFLDMSSGGKGLILKDGSEVTEDTNGNILYGSSSSSCNFVTCPDTLNRVLLTPTDGPSVTFTTPLGKNTSSPSPQYLLLAYSDSNGAQRNFRIDYEAIDVSTGLCGPITCYDYASKPTVVPSKVTLPSGTFYQFTWINNSGAQLQEVRLPTGGSIRYTYTPKAVCLMSGLQAMISPSGVPGSTASECRMEVTSRTVTGTSSATWNYTPGTWDSSGDPQTTVTDPYGNDEVHEFTYINPPTNASFETLVSHYSGSSTSGTGKLLKTVATTYGYDNGVGGKTNFRPIQETVTLDNGQSSRTTMGYETFQANVCYATIGGIGVACSSEPMSRMNLTTVSEYDFTGSLIRTTNYAYLHQTNPAYATLNIVDRVASETTYDSLSSTCQGQSKPCSQTVYEYDNYSHPNQPMGASGAVEHDANYSTSYTTRGNVTAVERWRNTDGAMLTTSKQYDDAGSILSSIDPLGYKTSYSFTDSWSNATCAPSGQGKAYVTTVTNALGQTATKTYNSCTASLASTEDPNRQTISYSYDMFDRKTEITYPDGGSTTNCYTDLGGTTCEPSGPPYQVVTMKAIGSSPVLNELSTIVYDGLGRVSQTQLNSDPISADLVDTTYDAVGRKSTVSNPHRSTSSSTDGTTTYVYDALSRICVVGQPDGTGVSQSSGCPTTAPAGDVFTSYTAFPCTTVTDEAGKARKSCVDGLGRMTGVWEDPLGLDYQTTYAYDALSNLISVTQNGSNSANARVRTFTYDSLSRLACAANPEIQAVTCPTSVTGSFPAGAITYKYDNDGNLVSKKAPLPNQTGTATVTTSSAYDTLNRITSKSYNDGVTPTTSYIYDQSSVWGATVQNPIGRMVLAGANNGTIGDIRSYDPMGRVKEDWEVTPFNSGTGSWPLVYAYDLAGDLISASNGAGTTISYSIDSAGRLSGATSSLSDSSHPPTLATVNPSNGYWPNGVLHALTFGNSLTETAVLNNRIQPCRLNLNSSSTVLITCADAVPGGNVQDFASGFNPGTNNGNMMSFTATGNQIFARTYTYDTMNRLLTMSDADSVQSCTGLTWTYDGWANRTSQSNTGHSGSACHTQSLGTFPISNQLPASSGYQYDAAGNLTYDTIHHYTYDAENRITQVDGGSTATYVYDALGRRVQKTADGVTVNYLYDSSGRNVSEMQGNTWSRGLVYFGDSLLAQYWGGSTQFVSGDHLGSSRLLTSPNQSIYDSEDFYPFGEQMSGASGTSHKFTGKERDSESGNDYFGARYYGSSLGRFMTPDPVGGHQEDPQTLNRYAYVRNNPLSLTDPTGLDFYMQCGSSDHKGCTQVQTDPNNSKSTQWVQAGADGKATIITSDSIRAGQNTATMSENGLQVNGSQGIYFDNAASHSTDANGNDVNHNSLDMAGNGDLKGFNFHVDGNCGGTCLSSGEWSAPGMTSAQAREALSANSFHIPFENFRAGLGFGDHPYSTQFRFGGTTFGCASSPCPNTPHLSVPFDPAGSFPKYNVPAAGGWHVDAHSGWSAHNQDINDTH